MSTITWSPVFVNTSKPASEIGTIAVAPRVWPAASMLSTDANGSWPPAANAVKKPGPRVAVVVMVTATASAPLGTSGLTLTVDSGDGRRVVRVSINRDGATGTNRPEPLVPPGAGTK